MAFGCPQALLSQGPALALAARLGASPSAGFVATGKGTAYSKLGTRTVWIELTVWGAEHSRLLLQFSGGGEYVAVVNSKQASTSGPTAWLNLPPVGGLNDGCDLLPQGLLLADGSGGAIGLDDLGASPEASGQQRLRLFRTVAGASPQRSERIKNATAVLLDFDPSTGLPSRAEYAPLRQTQVRVEYARYTAPNGFAYPSHVEKFVNGEMRLSVDFDSVEPRTGLSDADFQVPAPAHPIRTASGGRRPQ